MQSVKVAQLMLSAGNDKLSNAAKQLADIKLQKEKLQEQLCKQQETAKKAEGGTATVSAPPAKRSKLQLKSAQRDTNLRAGTLQPDRTF